MTKNILTIAFLFFSFAIISCSSEDTSLNGKKESVKKISAEIKKLQTELDSLTLEIKELEGVKEVRKTEVTQFVVKEETFNAYAELQGTSQAENNINLTTDMGGLVTGVFVEEGKLVSKGQVLIKLDNSVMQSQLAEVNTSLSLAKDVYEKRKRLWEQNIGSEIEYLQAKNTYNSVLDRRQTLMVSMGKANIKAPISGIVDKVFLKVGELAAPGMPAVNVINLGNMEVEVNVPETYLGKVKIGSTIKVEFPTLNKEIDAKVKSVSQSISSSNRTFTVVASIPNKEGELKPNLLAKVKIQSEEIKNAIAIPANLVQKSPQGYYVYVIDSAANGELQAKEALVKVGITYNGKIIITEGLTNGQKLINAGFRDVLNGDLLEVVEEKKGI